MTTNATVGSAAAAARLGVTVRQVQRWVASGDLIATRTVGNALLIDAQSLNAFARTRPARGRAWSSDMAWAALWMLSAEGALPVDLSARNRRRLADHLDRVTAEELLVAVRRRATVTTYRGSASFHGDITDALVLTGGNATDAGEYRLSRRTDDRLDGYCDEEDATRLIKRAHLVEDTAGSIVIRVPRTAGIVAAMTGGRPPNAVVAADLATSHDARERSEGLRVLRDLLGRA